MFMKLMSRAVGPTGFGVALVVAISGLTSPMLAQDTVRVTVVATADVHGRAMHWDYVNDREAPWGLTRAATVIDSLRRTEDDELILVDVGDFLQGNPFATYFAVEQLLPVHPIVDAFNVLQYDVVTLGDHEFDFGLPLLDTALSGALFQVVAANYYSRERKAPVYRDFAFLERHGARIGVVGLTNPGSMVWHESQIGRSHEVRRIPAEANRALGDLAALGVDLKVALVHGGLRGASSYDTTTIGAENAAARLARLPVKPDLVFVGHSHRSIRDSVINGVHFIQAPPFAEGLAVARVTLTRNVDGVLEVSRVVGEHVALASVRPDEAMTRRLKQADQAVRSWANAPIATSLGPWIGRLTRAEDSPLIDFVNEVQRKASGAQLSGTAAFNLNATIPSGDVRVRDVLGLYPNEYELTAVRIDGATLKAYLEHSSLYYRTYQNDEGLVNPAVRGADFDIVSGVDYVIDLSMPVGSRVRQIVYQGRLVEPDDRFTLALNGHRLSGSGGYDMLSRLPVVHNRGESVRDLLVAEMKEVGVLDSAAYYRENWRIIPDKAYRSVHATFSGRGRNSEYTALRVLGTADFFGAMAPRVTTWSGDRKVGGIGALKGWIDSLTAECRCATLVVDAGNQLRGSLVADRSHGKAVVDAFNSIGYDAATLGASDLEWGVDTLRARVADSHYPWLVANAHLKERTGTPDWASDWVMIERGDLSIGVIGVTVTDYDPVLGRDGTGDFTFTDPVSTVSRLTRQARHAGASYVVVVAHADAFCGAGSCNGELVKLAEGLAPYSVDLIVGGHSDSEATGSINGIPILLPGSYGLSLGVSDFVVGPLGRTEVRSTIETVWVDAVTPEKVFAFESTPVVTHETPEVGEPLARMMFAAQFDAVGESAMGRLMADSYRFAARAQIGFVSNSSLSRGLAAGAVTIEDLYEAQPIQYPVVKVTLSGAVLFEMLEVALAGGGPAANVSGINVWYDPERPAGDRVRRVEFTDDREIRRDREYTLAVSATVAKGGNEFAMLVELPVEDVGATDLDAIAEYLRRLPQPVEAPERDRFHAN